MTEAFTADPSFVSTRIEDMSVKLICLVGLIKFPPPLILLSCSFLRLCSATLVEAKIEKGRGTYIETYAGSPGKNTYRDRDREVKVRYIQKAGNVVRLVVILLIL